ncbi:MAG TPA: short chain dehydrogenase [Cryomorphaceae bacterium]|nr:short chain dehydrogenase [Owenweeksia sp.]MBF98156.1 short chain dehydrogenase [Owenweeksia sp.]HAD96730.1 short chain dehydrogenase [Cryomorphaceae bacterium]HBF20102.1 short chain dehydrogenase [Cryomorphaceae bacterium]|tara:strand:+ start:719 stop:1516 length:798 start_codon:yes stop_codon:yes gene_type:complete
MKNFKGKIIWITGASSGIGREMARQCSKMGALLILSSRREDALKEVQQELSQPENSMVLPLDMVKPEEFPSKVAQVLDRFGRVDLLFNNAGLSQRSHLKDTGEAVDRQLMEVNYFGPVALTKALLPQLRKQSKSHIAVVSSLAGKFGFYERSAYSASKHALHGFFEVLRLEEEENNIGVTMLCPGGIKTNISINAVDGSGNAYGRMSALQEEGMPVDQCVNRMISAIQSNRKEAIIGKGLENISVKVKALFPSLFYRLLKKRKPQ